jgi:hypothetical protein
MLRNEFRRKIEIEVGSPHRARKLTGQGSWENLKTGFQVGRWNEMGQISRTLQSQTAPFHGVRDAATDPFAPTQYFRFLHIVVHMGHTTTFCGAGFIIE